MGRVTELIDYINREYEPTSLVKIAEYTHISFTDEIIRTRREYRKRLKKLQKQNKGESNG